MKILLNLAVCTSVAAGFGLIGLALSQGSDRGRPPIKLEPIAHAPFDPLAIDQNIALHVGRVKRDPTGAIGWGMLAEAYLAESREYDRDTAAWKAEAAARKSLALRTRGNERAKAALVSSLLEQHRFQDALKTLDGFGAKQGRLRVDVLIELGQYAEAKKLIAKLQPEDPSAFAAMARIEMLQGKPDLAFTNLNKGRALVAANAGIGATTLAWYDVKLGDALAASGRRAEARATYDQAVLEHPRSYKAHLALARLNLAEKRYTDAIAAGQATMKIANSLDARAVIGDANLAMGDPTEANKWFASCRDQFVDEVATFDKLGKGGSLRVRPIDRQFAHFAATHRLYTKEALVAAKRDLANRPDRHAHDTVRLLTSTGARPNDALE